uniref:Ras and Rab interactor 2 n=1 Tax=Tetraodon nigroviridis TaxID=99883 RepID=H3D7A3_TETNG
RRLSVLDRLVQTHAVWLQLGLSHQEAALILQNQPAGTFLVRKSSRMQRKVISVRMDHDAAPPVQDFPVRENRFTFSLEGSGLSFADLFRLVAFCCISRDVLPFTLKLPDAVACARTSAELEEVAKLGAGFWKKTRGSGSEVSAPERPPPPSQRPVSSESTPGCPWLRVRSPSELDCCQPNGALCFINPLFIRIHQRDPCARPPEAPSKGLETPDRDGDPETTSPQPPHSRVQSTRRASPAGTASPSATASLPAAAPGASSPSAKHASDGIVDQSPEGEGEGPGRQPPLPPGLLLRRQPLFLPPQQAEPQRAHLHPLALPAHLSALAALLPPARPGFSSIQPGRRPVPPGAAGQHHRGGPVHGNGSRSPPRSSCSPPESSLQSGAEEAAAGQRLSDMSILTDSSDSLEDAPFFLPPLHDPNPPTVHDFDTHLPLSLPPTVTPYILESDQDQDQDQDLTIAPPGHRMKRCPSAGALVLLRKVSFVINSLMTPEKRATHRIVELSRNRSSYFGCLVQDYLSYTEQAWHSHATGLELLQTLRQFITQMKSYLTQSSELQPPIESLIPEEQIDTVLEKAMHKCVLKPLKAVVSTALRVLERSGEWRELRENLALAKARQPQELGVTVPLPPHPMAIEKVRQKFHTMIKLYSPEKKVHMLLKVCRLIYTIMEDNSGRPYGADDFLPMLTYVLAQCDLPQLDNEILYMMELLDPSLLQGEGGYYLISVFGAMSLIKNFQEDQAAKVLSSETRDTLHQWHRRRTTTLRAAPCIDDFQNYLRVALHELDSGCTAKTLQVRPHATVDEVCLLCANKFRVSEPKDYGLFLVMGGTSQQLAPDTHPQKIKAELHSRPQVEPFYFVYR